MAGDLLADYRAALTRRNYATETIKKRLGIVRRWVEHWGERWPDLTWHDVDTFGDQRGVHPSTWRDEISHLSQFYKWAIRNEFADRDPTVLVERPRVGKRLPRPAGEHDYRRLLDEAPTQLRAMIEIMAWCGLRCCEVARLERHDVDMIRRVAIVRGKGDRERIVGLPRRVVQALAAIDHGGRHVFVNRAGGPYTPTRISHLVSLHAHRHEIKISAHQLRHRFATLALELTGELDVVQSAMGHVTIATTEIYAKASERRVRELLRKLDDYDRGQVERLFE
jgi:integrase/recombinase XerD